MQQVIENLIARFRVIDEERMQDLPIYNPALLVEAIDFQPVDKGWLGVLITPWFINVMLLYKDTPPAAELGQMVPYELPSGVQQFMVGENEELGRYDFLSLASPVLGFATQQAAQHEARSRLAKLLTPEDETEHTANTQQVQFNGEKTAVADVDIKRRALLQGRLV